MGAPSKGIFTPSYPQKYLGDLDDIIYRSSYELTVMLQFDQNPAVLGWMSEGLPTNHVHEGLSGIPYNNPFTGRWTIYVPDFFVIYMDTKNKKHADVIEIKPLDEVPPFMSGVQGKVDKLKEAKQILNAAKFQAAAEHCAKRGWFFRVLTERELFASMKPNPLAAVGRRPK